MYNKTIVRFGFCDIQNNQGLGKGYLYGSANDPRTANDPQIGPQNDPGPEMIPDRDRKRSRLKNNKWHGWWDGVDKELAYVNTDVYIKAIL